MSIREKFSVNSLVFLKDLRYESASLRSVGGSIIGVSQTWTMTAQRREVHNMDAMAEENRTV